MLLRCKSRKAGLVPRQDAAASAALSEMKGCFARDIAADAASV